MENLKYNNSRLIVRGNSSKKQMALTYDTGFFDSETLKIIEVLNKHKVKATFFLTGIFVEDYKDIALKIIEHGHEIGNHSYSHLKLTKINKQEIIEQITKADKLIYESLGVIAKPYFREPFGAFNKNVLEAVGEAGYKYSIYWTIDTIDWQYPSARVIANRVLRKICNGAIVLMHIDGTQTAEATNIIINNAKAYGYKLVTISEIL